MSVGLWILVAGLQNDLRWVCSMSKYHFKTSGASLNWTKTAFTRLLLGSLLHLDPLQLGEARRLYVRWGRKVVTVKNLRTAPVSNLISINALHNYTFCSYRFVWKAFGFVPQRMTDRVFRWRAIWMLGKKEQGNELNFWNRLKPK